MATGRKKSAVSAADAVDQQLERYRSMRDFAVTAEPSGGTAGKSRGKAVKAATRAGELPFVIQKHAASHLHYDFRLGWNGVLKSWAVAKGPSYFPGDKRLAVQVEDHPIEYGGFEGIIPQGQYGGGTVMVWDQGTWAPQDGHEDVDAGLKAGSLKFTMQGSKMQGKWTLVRMGGKAAKERKPNWLLIKEHDEFERSADDPPVTEEEPKSAVTGRDLDEIAHNEDHVWESNKTAAGNAWYRSKGGEEKAAIPGGAGKKSVAEKKNGTGAEREAAKSGSSHGRNKKSSAVLKGARKEKLPEFIEPELATQVDRAPVSPGWVHELKLDGYRVQARKEGSKVQLLTRTGLDWTLRIKTIAGEVEALEADTALLDGEVVVLADDGTTSFADLQAAFQEGIRKPLTYFAFDLMHLDGHDLRGLKLIERKSLLQELVKDAGEFIRFSEHIDGSGEAMFGKACELGAEGIISKRAESRYSSGRSRDWLKLKCIHEQEFVIGGFTLPANGSHGVGALLLGYYEAGKPGDAGKLIYAGRTGTGFTQKTHRSLRDRLDELRRVKTAFSQLPGDAKGAIWVRPELVAQVRFATWTADGLLRQAAFKGLREDKPASEVRREEAAGKTDAGSDAAQEPEAKGSPKKRAVKKVRVEVGKAAKADDAEHAPVRLTHPDKVLDAKSKLTKQQLADYYWAIAPQMLAQIGGRPLSLVRCPEGSGKDCFYQKHAGATLPPEVGSIDVPDKKTGKAEAYITLDRREALAALAQMSVLEIHPWGSRNEDLEHPDRIIIDLDPDAAIDWKTLAASAAEVRRQLKRLGLESFLKSTGGKGLHVVVPIVPEQDWAEVKQFAHAFAEAMEQAEPSVYVTTMSKAARKGKIYIDYLRNERGSTAVAAYSPRAREGAPVSMPLEWSELKLAERPVFGVANFAEWKSRLGKDPWKRMAGLKQRIKQRG